jgi:hypothetical protein
LITETAALYQQSHLLTDIQNNNLNKFNFYLEIFLTLNVFISSFLVFSLEKDFWVGSKDTRQGQINDFRAYW